MLKIIQFADKSGAYSMKNAEKLDVNTWSISHDGRRISEHYSLEEAKNIARLLAQILDGRIEVYNMNGEEIEQKADRHLEIIS